MAKKGKSKLYIFGRHGEILVTGFNKIFPWVTAHGVIDGCGHKGAKTSRPAPEVNKQQWEVLLEVVHHQ